MEPTKEGGKAVAIIYRDPNIVDMLEDIARSAGFSPYSMLVGAATSADQVMSFVHGVGSDLVFLGENYQGNLDPAATSEAKRGEGLEVLARIRARDKTTPVYMISGGNVYRKQAMRLGANGYLPMASDVADGTGQSKNLSEEIKRILEMHR